MKTQRNKILSIAEIVKSPEDNLQIIGVVLDCTGTYKSNDSYDYITKVKLIDQTHNPLRNEVPTVEPFVTIFIFSETVKEAPFVPKIGDVMVLRNINFNTYDKLVKGKAHKRNSRWLVQDGRENISANICQSSQRVTLVKEEEVAIAALKKWSTHFFLNNSLLHLAWHKTEWPQEISSERTYLQKDVDLLLKVAGIFTIIRNKETYQRIAFYNAAEQQYFAECSTVPIELSVGMIVKLRSVCVVHTNDSNRIDFYNYSSILEVPPTFYDARFLRQKLQKLSFESSYVENQFLEEFHLDLYKKKLIAPHTYVYEVDDGREEPDVLGIFPILKKFKFSPKTLNNGSYI